jgi:hypothetical protein
MLMVCSVMEQDSRHFKATVLVHNRVIGTGIHTEKAWALQEAIIAAKHMLRFDFHLKICKCNKK